MAVPGKTKVVVIDGVIQYACAANREGVPGAEDIVFQGSDKSVVPTGLLPNLGKAGARNYYLDLSCGFSPHRMPNCSFLTKRQDAGAVQWARAYAGGSHPGDGGEWVENPTDIFSGWKEDQSCARGGSLSTDREKSILQGVRRLNILARRIKRAASIVPTCGIAQMNSRTNLVPVVAYHM